MLFLYPALAVAFLLWSLRYIFLPKRMLKLRREQGFKFEGLEQSGWLDGWIDDEIQEEIYRDWTLGGIEDFEKLTNDSKKEGIDRASEQRKRNYKNQLRHKFDDIAKMRKEYGLQADTE